MPRSNFRLNSKSKNAMALEDIHVRRRVRLSKGKIWQFYVRTYAHTGICQPLMMTVFCLHYKIQFKFGQ